MHHLYRTAGESECLNVQFSSVSARYDQSKAWWSTNQVARVCHTSQPNDEPPATARGREGKRTIGHILPCLAQLTTLSIVAKAYSAPSLGVSSEAWLDPDAATSKELLISAGVRADLGVEEEMREGREVEKGRREVGRCRRVRGVLSPVARGRVSDRIRCERWDVRTDSGERHPY